MKKAILSVIVGLAVIVALIGVFFATRVSDIAVASSERLNLWYSNEAIDDPATHMYSDSDGASDAIGTYCYAYGLGTKTMSSTGPEDVESLTGLSLNDALLADTQLAISDNSGSTTCQMSGTSMGFQLDKASIITGNGGSAVGSIYGMQMIRSWGSDLSRKPWSDIFGEDSSLRIQANYTVEQSYASGDTAQYGQFIVSLVDTTQTDTDYSNSIWLTISLWDSRGTHDESVHVDYGGTINYIIDTYAADGLDYVTLHSNSQNFAGDSGCGCDWYGVYVTQTNLIDAVTAVNATVEGDGGPESVYSLDPNDYAVNLIGGGTEMYSPEGSTGWIGSRFSNLSMFTEY